MPQTHPRIAATPRNADGPKSKLRALRRSGIVPGSVFGHGDPLPIQVPARALAEYLQQHATGALVDLAVDGDVELVLLRELDRDAVTGAIVNVGFQRVNLGEQIRSSIAIHFEGEEALTAADLVLQRQMDTLELTGRADRLPESIVVDVSGASAGDVVYIRDLKLPEGITPTKDPDVPVASVSAAGMAMEEETELTAELDAQATEGPEETGETEEEAAGSAS